MNRDLLEKFARHRSNLYNLTPSPQRRQIAIQQPSTEQEDSKPVIKKQEYSDQYLCQKISMKREG